MSDRHIEQGTSVMRQLYEFSHETMGTVLKKRGDKVTKDELSQVLREALPNLLGSDPTDEMVEGAIQELVSAGNIKETKSGKFKLERKKLAAEPEPTPTVDTEPEPVASAEEDEETDEEAGDDAAELAAIMAEMGGEEGSSTASATTAAAHEAMNNLDPSELLDDEEEEDEETDDDETVEGTGSASTETEPGTTESGEVTEDAPESASPPPIPSRAHRTANYNGRRFRIWAEDVKDIHSNLLRLLTEVDIGEIETLKEYFKQQTGEEWNEEFEINSYLAERKADQIDTTEDEEGEKLESLYDESGSALCRINDLFEQNGIPDKKTGDRDLDEIINYAGNNDLFAFGIDVRDEQLQIHEGDVVKAERALLLIFARIEDKLVAYQKERDFDNIPEETPELIAARTSFLKAQEDYNEFQKRLNPFKRGKKELVARLKEAREAYDVETAKAIAGRSHRFLNEFNRQIDEEIAIRQERIDAEPDGFIAKLKNGKFKDAFYGMYKSLGDMSLDRAYQKGQGEEPTKGRFLRKAVNVRTGIGAALGVAGLMTGPLKVVWRGFIGAGASIGAYEGLKAKESKRLQVDAHTLLATLETDADGVDKSKIIEVMQQIRMRAALDGKTVVDEKFILHKSFESLREALKNKIEETPEEKRIAARENAKKLGAELAAINARLEEDITRQGNQRRRQAATAVGVGVATAAFMPQIMKGFGWAAENVADFWVGDPAVSGDIFAQTAEQRATTAEHVTDHAVAAAESMAEDLPGSGARVTIDRGEGAYHAVYKLLDTMTEADQQELGQAIATEHPEWVQTDANGEITNLDRVLRHWRHDIVKHAVTDSGEEIMLYDASSGEYHTMLHTDAAFGITYDNGYPELRIYGADGEGTFNTLDEPLTRVVHTDGSTEFVPAGEEAAAIEAHESTFGDLEEGTAAVDALAEEMEEVMNNSPYEMVPDTVTVEPNYEMLGDVAADVSATDVAADATSGAAESVPTDTVAAAETEPAALDSNTNAGGLSPEDGVSPVVTETPEIAPELPEAPEPQTFSGENGRSVTLNYDSEGEISGLSSRMSLLRTGDVRQELLTHDTALGPASMSRDMLDLRLKEIFVFDEVIDNMIGTELEGTPEYEYLVSAVEQEMEIVAGRVGTPVEGLFDADLVEAYGFDEAISGEISPVEPEIPAAEAPLPDPDVVVTEGLYDRVIENRNNLTIVERDQIRLYLERLSSLGLQLDAATTESAQSAIHADMLPVRDSIVAILDTAEQR